MSNYNSEANTEDGSCVSWEELANSLQSELDNVVIEDGVSQEDVDAAYIAGAASVELPECEEVATQNIPLDLPQGWSMFGYTCLEYLDVVEAFSDISDNIEIVKDEWGLAYLPAWGFSAFSNLEFGEGYQIKMIEAVTDFQFCTTIAGGASQDELDAAIAEVHAMYEGWCESDLDNDGICDELEIIGCNDENACNFNASASLNDGEKLGVVGNIGSGKTTLFNIIAGFLPPDEGQIILDGEDLTFLSLSERSKLGISYLPQEPSIFRDMSVYDNIFAIAELFHSKEDAKKVTENLVNQFSLHYMQF